MTRIVKCRQIRDTLFGATTTDMRKQQLNRFYY